MPYHATLTPGQADSVPGGVASWWSMLTEWQGPAPHQPRSIEGLVAADPDALFMFVLSKAYLRACENDIAAACAHIKNADRLLIISAGARQQGELAAFMVPADARLQAHLGGTRRALNARIAAHMLATAIRGREETTEYLARLLASQPPMPRYDRTSSPTAKSSRSSLSASRRRRRRQPIACFATSAMPDSHASSTGLPGYSVRSRRRSMTARTAGPCPCAAGAACHAGS